MALLVGLWFLRVPSLAQPMAGDQALYAYAGERLLEGAAPYAEAWDQKPPGIHVVYAAMWAIWPHESVVAGADLVVAGLVAWLLLIIGRRHFTEGIGVGAAAIFLLFGNPSIAQGLSGVYVRGQCETFIALAITGVIALVASHSRTRRHLIAIGVLLGCAFWLKPNAAAYALVVLVALAMWPRNGEPTFPNFRRDVLWVAGAGALTVALPLAAIAWSGSLLDLRLATLDYNLAYSGDTYAEQGPLRYLLAFPIARAENDALWILGGLGCIAVLVSWVRAPRDNRALCSLVALAWMAAACLSILINGARDLPQYFVQFAPALALVAAVGLAPLLRGWRTRPLIPAIVMVLLIVAVSRPGDRGHLPTFVERLAADWSELTGHNDPNYLARWFTGKKFMAAEVDELATDIRATTAPTDTIYVFGFSPGVFVKSDRRSASRFHWSRPVVIEFAADTPGYGSAALLGDLTRERPAVVALQKQDWGPGEPNSIEFFHANAGLNSWLSSGYQLERETPLFEVWRRR